MPDSFEPHPPTKRPPVVVALAAHAVGFALVFGLAQVLGRQTGTIIALPLLLAGQGVVAAILGMRWGLARWWLPINMVLPIVAGAALLLELPSWFFGVAFVLLVVVYWNASTDRVPLYLSNPTTWRALSELLPPDDGGRFLDLGSGIGGTTLHLAGARPDMTFDGIESAPGPYLLSWVRWKLGGRGNACFRYGDFWSVDLGDYDVVYAFLSPAPMAKLFDKVRREMKPGSVFISNSFAVPGETPDNLRILDDGRRTNLLIWRM